MVLLPERAPDYVRTFAARHGLSVTAGHVLWKRGHTDTALLSQFLEPKLSDICPPEGMKGYDAAILCIVRAMEGGDPIVVFGDYDADGITSTALLTSVMRRLGANVAPLIADRKRGGYGLSDMATDRVLALRPKLVLTCDCGSSDHARIDRLRREGVEVVVIDHHQVPDQPLPATAFLNPHQPGCGFTFKGLASVGLAFYVAAGLRKALGKKLDLRPWLELVALGTIADMAPLVGDNRALVSAGLARLGHSAWPGLRALADISKTGKSVSGLDVSFGLAPRINAPGRLADPSVALDLLLCEHDADAAALANTLEQVSNERKTLDRSMFVEALSLLDDPAAQSLPVAVVGKQGWHPGVVGIVAAKLVAHLGKPSVVLSVDGELARGSVRGPAGIRLYDALTSCKDLLLKFGGHQAAAALDLRAAEIDAFRQRFAEACVAQGFTEARKPVIEAETLLEAGDSLEQVLGDFSKLEPCGQGNPPPRVGLARARVRSAREVRGGHLTLELDVPGIGSLRGFALDMGPELTRLRPHIDVVGTLRPDTYRGQGGEIKIDGVHPSEP